MDFDFCFLDYLLKLLRYIWWPIATISAWDVFGLLDLSMSWFGLLSILLIIVALTSIVPLSVTITILL